MKSTESLTWILYDIGKDRDRNKVAKVCKEAGLHRVQKSVFVGPIEHNRLDELAMRIEDLINSDEDKVYIFPMCEMDFRKVILQGQAFDRNLVHGDIRSLFV
jgi:CRISPR-associated protein Cas2